VSEAKPYPKEAQLARGEKRYRRKVASGKRWQALWDAKRGPCRICGDQVASLMELHHLVFRSHFGDDVEDNLVPLCSGCHCAITLRRSEKAARTLLAGLTDAEYAYMVERGGEGYAERAYGIECSRA
jgi:5-methylcytosine-specific restriction endonuclease McrA